MTALNFVSEQLRARPIASERPQSLPVLLRYEETLLQEVHHRVGNSLQIIASMLALDARNAKSEEARRHLVKAHRRIVAVATVQQQLQTRREGDLELGAYLRQLAENLTASVIGDATRIRIDVRADAGTVSSAVAMNTGLIVTELVINALKHAFMDETATGVIAVTYRIEGHDWRLTVLDNGVDTSNGARNPTDTGLGTGIVAALVRQLHGRIETGTGLNGLGTLVSITGRLPSPSN